MSERSSGTTTLEKASAAHVKQLLSLRGEAIGVCTLQEGAIETADVAYAKAIESANEALATSISDVSEIDNQLAALGCADKLDVPPRMPRGYGESTVSKPRTKRGAKRGSKGTVKGTSGGQRARSPATLPDTILLAMNDKQWSLGDEWSIPEILEVLPTFGFKTKATTENFRVTVSQALNKLHSSQFIGRPSRGVYVLTKRGSQKAVKVTEGLNTSVEIEVKASK